jgi:hypothetical protein
MSDRSGRGDDRVGMGLSARRLLPGEPVHRLPEEVGMAVVPRVLLDHVAQDPIARSVMALSYVKPPRGVIRSVMPLA